MGKIAWDWAEQKNSDVCAFPGALKRSHTCVRRYAFFTFHKVPPLNDQSKLGNANWRTIGKVNGMIERNDVWTINEFPNDWEMWVLTEKRNSGFPSPGWGAKNIHLGGTAQTLQTFLGLGVSVDEKTRLSTFAYIIGWRFDNFFIPVLRVFLRWIHFGLWK